MVDSNTDTEIKEIQDTSAKKMSKKEIGQAKSILQAPTSNKQGETHQPRMSSISASDQSDQFISHDDLFKS